MTLHVIFFHFRCFQRLELFCSDPKSFMTYYHKSFGHLVVRLDFLINAALLLTVGGVGDCFSRRLDFLMVDELESAWFVSRPDLLKLDLSIFPEPELNEPLWDCLFIDLFLSISLFFLPYRVSQVIRSCEQQTIN